MAETQDQQAAAAAALDGETTDAGENGSSAQKPPNPAEQPNGPAPTEKTASTGRATPQKTSETDGGETDGGETDGGEAGEGDTFPRAYVEKLRSESAERRTEARELRAALWQERVAASGRLADPADLPMPDDADPRDADAIHEAIDALLQDKPHFAARRASGSIGQHEKTSDAPGVSLVGMMQRQA